MSTPPTSPAIVLDEHNEDNDMVKEDGHARFPKLDENGNQIDPPKPPSPSTSKRPSQANLFLRQTSAIEALRIVEARRSTIQSIHFYVPTLKDKVMEPVWNGLWAFPVVLALLLPINCCAVYGLSVYLEQIEPWLPYVSDSATNFPQSSFFALVLDLCGLLLIFTSYGRHKHIQYYLNDVLPKHIQAARMPTSPTTCGVKDGQLTPHPLPDPEALREEGECREAARKINDADFKSLLANYLAVIGLFVVGNFRMDEYFFGNLIGLGIVFTGTVTAMSYQILAIRRLVKYSVESRPITLTIVTSLVIVLAAAKGIFFWWATYAVGVERFLNAQFRKGWTDVEPGYQEHAWSALVEWMAIGCFSAMFLCYANRMRHFQGNFPRWWRRESMRRPRSVSARSVSLSMR